MASIKYLKLTRRQERLLKTAVKERMIHLNACDPESFGYAKAKAAAKEKTELAEILVSLTNSHWQ